MKTGSRLATILIAVISTSAAAAPFRVTSSDMREGDSPATSQQFNGFGCRGECLAPVDWEHAPTGTRSFAVTAYDRMHPAGAVVALDGGEYTADGFQSGDWCRR